MQKQEQLQQFDDQFTQHTEAVSCVLDRHPTIDALVSLLTDNALDVATSLSSPGLNVSSFQAIRHGLTRDYQTIITVAAEATGHSKNHITCWLLNHAGIR